VTWKKIHDTDNKYEVWHLMKNVCIGWISKPPADRGLEIGTRIEVSAAAELMINLKFPIHQRSGC
jgi:hypothetical protein